MRIFKKVYDVIEMISIKKKNEGIDILREYFEKDRRFVKILLGNEEKLLFVYIYK